MNLPKYTRPEFERRFLVAQDRLPPLASKPYWIIHDKYLHGGRLRLRRIQETDTGNTLYKLCKKFESSASEAEPIVNIYLSRAEYEMLQGLEGSPLTKRRYHDDVEGARFGIDVFEGELEGLLMCEVEAPTAPALQAIHLPPYAGIEVTAHGFFRGGVLCRASREDLAHELAQVGLTKRFR